jgi:integrase
MEVLASEDSPMDTLPTPITSHLLTVRSPSPRDQHPASVYLARLGVGSRRTLREALDTTAGLLTGGKRDLEELDWAALRYQHPAALRARLITQYQPATVNKMLAAVKGVLRACWRLGQMTAEEYHRTADLPAVRGSTLPKGRALTLGELRALFVACAEDPSATGRRDAAMLAVLYGAGVRRAELVALNVNDYDGKSGALSVRAGKGRKERVVYATNGARAALQVWLAIRGEPEVTHDALFVRIRKGNVLTTARLTDQAVYYVLANRLVQAGVQNTSPHDLRRTFISTLWDAGVDGATIQQLAGHASITTTARYDRRDEVAKKRAAEMIHVPFVA